MPEQDFFRDIAMTKHPIGENDKEVEPVCYPKIVFTETQDEFAWEKVNYHQDLSYHDRCQDMKQELSELKERYKPFMRNFLPTSLQMDEIIELNLFDFRYQKEHEKFSERNNCEIAWEKVKIPDYRGPADEDGKWRAYYKKIFSIRPPKRDERILLRFQCVDYKAIIYINGNYVGSHEGFFAPFEFDITDYIEDSNELIVECQNDYTILGTGAILDGDKIYAATGPGWDDPVTGWHHCPAGAGIFGKVTVEYRPTVYIEDIFVRPNIDKDYCEIRIGIINYENKIAENYTMDIELLPKNYEGSRIGSLHTKVRYIGIGKNEYRYMINIENYRLWELEEPYLYGAVVDLKKQDSIVSSKVKSFGIKKLISDEESQPKGKFYFNNRPIILRGANEMGHLQQCVMKGDYDLLIEDILIAKLCHLNYYRITQRPVQEEIYDYFDMLGMMHQCDFPLFAFLRRNQFSEAIKQVTEMEHLIRPHVSSMMVTFINEPMRIRKTEDPLDKYSKRYEAKGHRHLLRDELEAFFVAARKAIYIENPDRVIKNVEGDYDAPTAQGMPDFHTYTMWYTNHGEPIGRLMKGYLPPVKAGWMIGCGEYGAEGLDNLNIIQERYPKEWLTTDENGHWYPDRIVKAQTFGVHKDWYPEKKTIEDWVYESQKHQAAATTLMTDAFRRRADVMNQTAIHLLVDAWPAGWMKALVCCDRTPKPAYFAYKDALEPLRVNLYSDRNYVYSGETIEVEAWLLNDLPDPKKLRILAEFDVEGKIKTQYKLNAEVNAVSCNRAGLISIQVPQVDHVCHGYLRACIVEDNRVINAEYISFYLYPRYSLHKDKKIYVSGSKAKKVAQQLSLSLTENPDCSHTAFISDFSKERQEWLWAYLNKGKKAVLLLPECDMNALEIGDININTEPCTRVFFAASDEDYTKYHFSMLHNKEAGCIDALACRTIRSNCVGRELVYTYSGQETVSSNSKAKKRLPFVMESKVGSGTLIVVSLLLQGRLNYNPNLDAFLRRLLSDS